MQISLSPVRRGPVSPLGLLKDALHSCLQTIYSLYSLKIPSLEYNVIRLYNPLHPDGIADLYVTPLYWLLIPYPGSLLLSLRTGARTFSKLPLQWHHIIIYLCLCLLSITMDEPSILLRPVLLCLDKDPCTRSHAILPPQRHNSINSPFFIVIFPPWIILINIQTYCYFLHLTKPSLVPTSSSDYHSISLKFLIAKLLEITVCTQFPNLS